MTSERLSETRTFTCHDCGETCKTTWSDEERDAEALAHFGPEIRDVQTVRVCSDCYELRMRIVSGRN